MVSAVIKNYILMWDSSHRKVVCPWLVLSMSFGTAWTRTFPTLSCVRIHPFPRRSSSFTDTNILSFLPAAQMLAITNGP